MSALHARLRSRPAAFLWLAGTLVASVGCTGAAANAPLSETASGTTGPVELDGVTVGLERTHDARLQSLDGVVSLYVPARSVDTTASLTLARLTEDRAPTPRVGQGYILRVEGGVLAAPARVEWRVRADVAVPVGELRVATLDPETGALTALPDAQVGAQFVAANVRLAGVLVLVDRREVSAVPTRWAPDVPAYSSGDALLWRADVVGARAAYHAARGQGPSAPAALGRAVTDLMLLLGQAPVSDVLLRCGLPGDVLLTSLLGPEGAWARAAEDRAGSAALQLTDASGTRTWRGNEVYTRAQGARVTQVVRTDGLELRWEGPPPNGAVDRSGFGGQLEVRTGGDVFRWEAGAAGTLAVQAGRTPGAPVAVTLTGLVLTGPPGTLTVNGTVGDLVTTAPTLLGLAEAGLGITDALRVLVQGCSADVTEPWLRQVAQQLRVPLASIASDLDEAASASTSAPLLELPPGLTRLPRALKLTARDARVAAGLVRGARAALGLLAHYRVAGRNSMDQPHPLRDFITDGERHIQDASGAITTVPARVWDLERISRSLNADLLVPEGDSSQLETVRADLVGALAALRASAAAPSGTDGVLEFSALEDAGLLQPLAVLLEALEASLPAGAMPVPLPGAPGFSAALGAALDAPPTRDALLAANGGAGFTEVFDGSPQGRTPDSRDPLLLLADRGFSLALWGAVLPGPLLDTLACGGGLPACASGFACVPVAVGTCGSTSDNQCVIQDGCADAELACVQPTECRRQLPPSVDWDALAGAFVGPTPAALAEGAWALVQPIGGMDPARAPAP